MPGRALVHGTDQLHGALPLSTSSENSVSSSTPGEDSTRRCADDRGGDDEADEGQLEEQSEAEKKKNAEYIEYADECTQWC